MAVNFLDDIFHEFFLVEVYILVFSLLAIVYVGVNRLSLIPPIASVFNAMSCFVTWYVHVPGADGKKRETVGNTIFADFWYVGAEIAVVLYGYFILEKLLPPSREGWILSRRTFLSIFWPLQVVNVIFRICYIVIDAVSMANGQRLFEKLNPIVYIVVQITFLVVVVMECLTAYLLIALFRRSRRTSIRFLGGKRLGLFKHFLLSTEIRVSSVALLALTRAGCELPKRTGNLTAARIDSIAVDLNGLFPLLLVADCIFRKSVGLEMQLQDKLFRNNGNNQVSAAQQLGMMGSEQLPSIAEKSSAGAGVVEIDLERERTKSG